MIRVYHSKELRTSLTLQSTYEEAIKDCEHVATVNTEHLETAYHLTNHIDNSWYDIGTGEEGIENKVKVIKESRSSSVGDVFIKGDGTAYIVAMLGFEKLAKIEFAVASDKEDICSDCVFPEMDSAYEHAKDVGQDVFGIRWDGVDAQSISVISHHHFGFTKE